MLDSAEFLLMFVVLPLWIAAGSADYFCHRATRIETTSGVPESLLHLLQFGLVGLPVALAMVLEANAGLLAFAAIMLVLHHIVAAIDLSYADKSRRIAPREQMVHSLLEIMPLTAFLLLAVLNWPQLLALFGAGPELPRFAPQVRILPPGYIAAALGAAFFLNFLPYGEELLRCLRNRPGRRRPGAPAARI